MTWWHLLLVWLAVAILLAPLVGQWLARRRTSQRLRRL